MRSSAAIDRLDAAFDGTLRIPGGTFRMETDKHCPEDAPAHRLTVSEFLIDRRTGSAAATALPHDVRGRSIRLPAT